MSRPLPMTQFLDRAQAGAALGSRLAAKLPADDYLVLGLLRGGVPIAAQVAAQLKAPCGVLAVKKLGLPSNPELAFGAVAAYRGDTARIYNRDIHRRALQYFGADELNVVELGTTADLKALADRFTQHSPAVAGRRVVLCDDGIATGATVRAALELMRRMQAQQVVVAAPVAPAEVVEELAEQCSTVLVLLEPENFTSVGAHYRNFPPVTHFQVEQILAAPEDFLGGGA